MANNPNDVRLTVLMKLQEAIDEEAILEEQILALMHRFADRFTDRRVEINNLMVLHDHPLVDYGKYALGCMTGADMKKCVYLKSVMDELLRSMEEKRSVEVQPVVENIKICSNQEDWEARRDQIKMTKGFNAKESVKGHMVNLSRFEGSYPPIELEIHRESKHVSCTDGLQQIEVNVVRGLKLYENILTDSELTRLNVYVNKLRVAGKNRELSGETFIMYNQQSKANKRELIQFGAPIFGQIKDEGTTKSQDSHIEPIPAPLEGVINHLIKYHFISENRRPNSCIISFFDEGEYSQPFLKPPHLDQPISTLVLSESTMAFGRTLVCDKDANYKGPLMLSLNEGSLLVMRGNSSDMARHVMCQSPTKRISITFFKVRTDSYEKNSSTTSAMTVWQPSVPTPYPTPNGTLNSYNSMNVVSKWGVNGATTTDYVSP
ncbi:putative oxidoreductase, 2OG-Fe(II) oxygenase family protein, partial [Tanacetum coccineum]